MKSHAAIITGFALLFTISASAQTIQSITMSPANPTPNDTIYFYAECLFPSGGCDQVMQTVAVSGNDVYATALHCLGSFTVICPHTDTLVVAPLPAGNYTFHFQVDAGFGPIPCTPGIVPGPSDSLVFVVSPTVGTGEFIAQDEVAVFPNPFTDAVQITGADPKDFPLTVEVYSLEGKLIQSTKVYKDDETVDVKNLSPAAYQLRIINNNGRIFLVPAIKN